MRPGQRAALSSIACALQTITRWYHTFVKDLSYTLLTMLLRLLAPVFAVLLGTSSVRAQDTRNVTEPHYPTPCKILYAQLSPHNGTLPEEPISPLSCTRARTAATSS